MYSGGHGQPPGPPSQGPGPVGAPGSGGDGWNPIQGMGSSGTGLGISALGQTMLPGQLGMNTLGTIITAPGPTQTTTTPGAGAGAMLPSSSGAPANISPIGSGSLTPPGDASTPHFLCPRRPNLGREGRPIMLRANHFQVMPRKHECFYRNFIYLFRFLCPAATSTTT